MAHIRYVQEASGFASSLRTVPPALNSFPLMKPLEASGIFWLPDAEHAAIWGKLEYSPGNSTSLILDGVFASEHGGRGNLEFPTIYGRLYNGAPCVLRDAWGHVETFFSRTQIYRTRIHARTFMYGEDAQVDLFCGVATTFSHLNAWFAPPVTLDYPNNDDDCLLRWSAARQSAAGNYRESPFTLEVECEITLPGTPGVDGVEFKYQYMIALLPSTPQTLEWHLGLAGLIREFFMFLVGSGVSTLRIEAFAGTKPWKQIVKVFPTIAVPSSVRLNPRYFGTSHQTIAPEFQSLLDSWLSRSDELEVVRETLSDLFTVDGASRSAVFTRVVQTMEHFHGLVYPDKQHFVPKSTWRGFLKWLKSDFPYCWQDATASQAEELLQKKEALIGRMGHINAWSFRNRLRALFDEIPPSDLMPMIDNPHDRASFLDDFLMRLEATRNYLTHFDESLRPRTFEELETPTLQCWAVLMYSLARYLGLSNARCAEIGMAARRTLVLVKSAAPL